jgi:hypothetical protein
MTANSSLRPAVIPLRGLPAAMQKTGSGSLAHGWIGSSAPLVVGALTGPRADCVLLLHKAQLKLS